MMFEPVIAAATDAAWRQWSAISSGGPPDAVPAHTIIDPEALVLGSLALVEREPRFGEVLHDWVILNARVLSVPRLRTLVRDFPITIRHRLASLAQFAMIEGNDARWRSLQIEAVSKRSLGDGRLPRPTAQAFGEPAALWFRLRMALGVSAKADLLTFLLGQSSWVGVPAITRATGYAAVSARRSLEELATGGFIDARDLPGVALAGSREYRTDRDSWQQLARLDALRATWDYWKERFALVAHLIEFEKPPNHALEWNRDQLAEYGRAFMEHHSGAFRIAGDGVRFRGTSSAWAMRFEDALQNLAVSMRADR